MGSPGWASDYHEVLFACKPARSHLIVGHYWHCPGRPCSGNVHLYAWHTPYLFWYMSGISGACILDSGTSSFPVYTVGELCCAPVPICGTYSSIHMDVPTGACYLQFPGFTIYHAVGSLTCPVKFQAHGTSVLSLIRRTFRTKTR